MPSSKQDRQFAESIRDCVDEVKMSNTTLDTAIDWIQSNLEPEDVFDEKQLKNWAESNSYTKE